MDESAPDMSTGWNAGSKAQAVRLPGIAALRALTGRRRLARIAAVPDQAATVAFLSRAESYGERGLVERIETHISIVFLVGERAFKLKRAVAFSYLDFSTLAARQKNCEA